MHSCKSSAPGHGNDLRTWTEVDLRAWKSARARVARGEEVHAENGKGECMHRHAIQSSRRANGRAVKA
jgi:hypothetical protein